jgi:cytochrome bd-I ubiquinol oxidase subunit X
MWYFSWALGTAMAVLLAVVNAMWFETQHAPMDDAAE